MDVIIGAGVSGIAYAGFSENKCLLLEKDAEIGGYCKTIKQGNFVWDYSGHFFHFRNTFLEDYVCRNMVQDDILRCEKHTQIFYGEKYIDFPFQKNIHQLDKEELIDCLYDLFSVNQGSIRSFKEMVYANYGKSIAEKFLIPYNEKLYACDLDRLDMNAMGRFFPKANKEDIISNFRSQDNSSYNSSFTYPKGGAVEYVQSLLKNVDSTKVCLNEELLEINIEEKVATTNKRKIKYDRLISTQPLPSLLEQCRLGYESNTFSCNKVLVFNLGFDSKGDDQRNSWVYVPEKDYIFYRLGYYDNILGTDKMSLYVEIGFPEDEVLCKEGLYLDCVMNDLKKMGVVTTQKLVDYETVLMKPAYVHISKESQEAISRYKSILKEKDIYSIGRYGSWTYCSIEDNILEAKEVALEI